MWSTLIASFLIFFAARRSHANLLAGWWVNTNKCRSQSKGSSILARSPRRIDNRCLDSGFYCPRDNPVAGRSVGGWIWTEISRRGCVCRVRGDGHNACRNCSRRKSELSSSVRVSRKTNRYEVYKYKLKRPMMEWAGGPFWKHNLENKHQTGMPHRISIIYL